MKEPTKDDNTKPMYCKDKIYCGADEYSFEELRAVRWLKKQEKRQREEEEQRALEGGWGSVFEMRHETIWVSGQVRHKLSCTPVFTNSAGLSVKTSKY